MSVFVVNYESSEGTKTVGVYFTEKLAKSAAKDYVQLSETMKKKQVKSDDIRKVLFEDKENKSIISMCQVSFELPKTIKKTKDPLAPKKGLSAYMIYAKENRKEIINDYISLYNETPSFGETGKLIGNTWKSLSDQDKKSYINKSDKDKKRYEDDLKKYTEKSEE